MYTIYNEIVKFSPLGTKIKGRTSRKTREAQPGQEIKITQGPSGV